MSNFDAREYLKNKYRKPEEDDDNVSKYSSETNQTDKFDARKYMQSKIASSEFGLDTLESDLSSLGTTINSIYNEWQTPETMKNTLSSVESMYDRLGSYKTYQRLFGDKGNDANIDDLRGSYRKAIEGWDTLASEYSIYKNAEAHSKEKAKLTELYSMNSSDIEPYLKDKNKPIAYTTATGENIKWQDLYNLTKVKELEDEVKNDKNFAENSKYEKKDVEYQRAWGSAYSVASDKDAHEYNYINKDKSAVEHEQLYSVLQYNTNDDEKNAYFKPEEIAIYNALAKTQGYDKAREYVKLLSPTLRQRRIEAERIHDAQMATENPFGSSFASVIGNVGNNMIGLPLTIADAIDGDGIDENSSLYREKRQVDTIRGTVEDNIDNDVGKFFYRHGMNVADNLATMAVSGGGKLGNVSKVLQSGLYASGAFTDTVLDAKSRGLSDEKAMTLGAISAAAETYFESKSFEKFFDSDTLSNSAWKYFVNNLKTELFGELATEGVSDVADILLSQDVSQWKLETDKYKASGMTGKEAFNKAFKNAAFKYLDVGAGSIFSTGVMAGPSAIGGAAVNHHANKAMGKTIRSNERVGDMLDLASTMTPDEASAYEAYTRYAKKGVNADNISDAQLGNLYYSTKAEAVKGKHSKDTTDEIKKRASATLDKLNEIDNDNLALKEAKANTQSGKENASNFTTGEVTEVASTGNSATIQGIKVDGDNTTLITTEGEVKSSDMNFSTRDADLVGHAQFIAKEHGDDVANVFLQQYDGKADVTEYAEAFNLVMTYADKNYTQDTILARKGILSAEQATEIYKATVHQQFETQQKAVDAIVERQGKSMTIKGTFDDSIIDRNSLTTDGSKVNWNTLTTRQRGAINFARMFSKATGVNIRLIKSEVVDGERKGENGSYDPKTNTISIDVYAGIIDAKSVNDSIIPTLAHEITHWAKAKASAIYETLRNDVMNTLAENDGITSEKRISEELARLKEAHPEQEFTEEDAIDEIIARACEDMLSNSNYAIKLLNKMSPKEQKKFRNKIKETFDNLMQWVNDLLAQYKSNSDEAEVLRRYKYKLQKISKTWDNMIESAVGANQALQREGVLGETLVNGISKDGTTIVGGKAVQMSERTYREGGRDFLVNWLENQEDLSDADKKDILVQTDAIAKLMKSIREGNDLPEYSRWANMEVVKDENGEKVLSVIVKNGDYAMNIDFSQVCKKRVALNAVLNAMVQSGDLNVYTLTETDVADLNAIIKKHEFEIACALCFVDSKRYRVGGWAESFCEGSEKKKNGKMVHQYGFNEMVRSLVPKGSNIKVDEFNFTGRDIVGQPTTNLLSEADDSELDFTLIDEIMAREKKADGKSTDLYAYAKAIRDNKDIRKILNPAEIISSIGLDNIRLESPEVYRLINRHQGTARPKFSHDIVAYGNDILKAKNFTAEKAKMVGGVRCQSFSDFMANMVMDYAQFISELSAKQLTAHTYTKEPLFVKLFGLTGMKINMSLVPKAIDMTPEQQKKFAILKDKNANKRSPEYKQAKAEYDKLAINAGLDENGNYIWEDETFPYDVAMDIVVDPRYSANCGTIAVGISDRHILKLLDDDRISMVIPYHKSGLNHDVAIMRDIALYKDYTNTQRTRFANGKKLENTPDFDFYGDLYGTDGKEGTHDPKITTENYLKWCDEHNYIPKFEVSTKSRKFRDNPNYYKLLTDFRVYDTDGTYREQQPVKTIYPSNDEFKDLILNGVTDKNGKVYGGLKQQQATTDKLSTESQQIIDEYREVLKEKYGKDVLKKKYSERVKKDSAHDLMGEGERLEEENAKLKADVERLKERLALEKKVTNGNHFNENQLNAVANHLRTISKSILDKASIITALREIYSYIAHSPNLTWDEVLEMCYSLAETMLAEAKPEIEVNDFYKQILKDIKSTRISLDSVQKGEAEARFGKNYNRYFFGKVILASDGISLDSKWKEWADQYPGIFDAESTDQVGDLFDIINKLHEASEVVVEYDAEEHKRWLANEIYNQYWNVSTIKTTADKYDKKIRLLNSEHRRIMTELREDYNARMKERLAAQKLVDDMHYKRKLRESNEKSKEQTEKVKLAYDMHYGRLLRNLEVKAEQRLDKTKAQAQEKFEQYKENAERKTLNQRIASDVFALKELLAKNDKDKHIPEVMKPIVASVITSLDFSSRRMLDKGIPTQKDISLYKALDDVKNMMSNHGWGEESLGELYGLIDDKTMQAMVDKAWSIKEDMGDNEHILENLPVEELKTIAKSIKAIRSIVNKANKYHVAKFSEGAKAHGVATINEVDMRRKIYKNDDVEGKKHLDKLKSSLLWKNTLPVFAFRRLGPAGEAIFSAVQDGQDKLAFLSKEIIDTVKKVRDEYKAKGYDTWKDKYFDFEITEANGNIRKFSMNVPQIMSLYCVSKQDDAKRHLLHGNQIDEKNIGKGKGITLVETKKRAAIRTNITLKEADLNKILKKLDEVPGAKEVADRLQEFMCTRGAELGNEISMARWGIKSFGIKNYFPIKVSEGTVDGEDTPRVKTNPLLVLLNMSFTKARNQYASQSIEIGDFFDVFSNHMADMAKYNAFALPILDMYKWMKFKTKGNLQEASVQKSITETFGVHGWNYFRKFMEDLNGSSKSDTRDNLAVKFFKKAKLSKVSANMGVAGLQVTSFYRASAVIDDKYLAKALSLKGLTNKGKEKALKYCGIAIWKKLGYFDTDINRGLAKLIKQESSVVDKINDIALKGAEKADEATWGLLWNACEFETRDKRKDLEVGSEEFFQAVGLRLRDVIYKTQVVDSVLTRSDIMRSKGAWDKMLTMFMSEPTLSFNLNTDALINAKLDARSIGWGKSWKKNRKYILKTTKAMMVTSVVVSIVGGLFDWFRDDEEEKDAMYFLKLFGLGFLEELSMINKLPYLNNIYSVMQGYSQKRTDVDWMSETVNMFKYLKKGDSDRFVKYGLKAFSDVTGIGAYNVYRDIKALIDKFE